MHDEWFAYGGVEFTEPKDNLGRFVRLEPKQTCKSALQIESEKFVEYSSGLVGECSSFLPSAHGLLVLP